MRRGARGGQRAIPALEENVKQAFRRRSLGGARDLRDAGVSGATEEALSAARPSAPSHGVLEGASVRSTDGPEVPMSKKIAVFWPGDARDVPNQLALPNVREATARLEQALKKLGRVPYQVEGYLSKPHHAIEKLGPIDDPMIGVCVHWLYGPHTTDGVVGKDNPLLLASNFSGRWRGLVGLAQYGRLPREPQPAFSSRLDGLAQDGPPDEVFIGAASPSGARRAPFATPRRRSRTTRPSRPPPRAWRGGGAR